MTKREARNQIAHCLYQLLWSQEGAFVFEDSSEQDAKVLNEARYEFADEMLRRAGKYGLPQPINTRRRAGLER